MTTSSSALKRIARPMVPRWLSRVSSRRRLYGLASHHGLTLSFHPEFSEISRGIKTLRIAANHVVYLPHLLESFDYYFESVVPVESAGNVLVDLSGPRYHRLTGFDELPLIFPSLSEPYITTAQYFDFARLDQGNVVLDIGAYAAVTSILFASKVGPAGKVFAFEADKGNAMCAKENVRLAGRWLGLSNIELTEAAVWSHGDGLEFSTEGTMGSSAVSIVGPGRGTIIKVPSTTITEFVARRGVDRVDFIKMDIEGSEIEVLKSSQNFLTQFKPRLIIEPHYVDGIMSTNSCRNILDQCGYEVRLIEQIGSSTPLIAASCI